MDDDCLIELPEDFRETLQLLFDSGSKVSLIVDNGGWERAEGFIQSVAFSDPQKSIVLDNGTVIDIAGIAAVNGLFKRGCICC
ncbi:MAG: hypothetical protein KIT80_16810 [Chitinophagaceae bacterium]|nr:hypothetical protein [Chitinophagaceae bacterium]MCW5928581.1 hypothetical protein [Chitinophagaceae bacterium]